MISEVGICNIALARLGDDATVASINPPEGSAQAEHCARFYPVARDTLLEMHTWGFATRRAKLALLSAPTWNWSYAYAAPNGALKLLSVLPEHAASDAKSEPFEVESDAAGNVIIRTSLADATLKYTARVIDTTRFSPLFDDALAWLLAAYLAGPLIKGDAGAQAGRACYQSFYATLAQAKVSDANQGSGAVESSPAWISGR
jgi:hypothetical protein